MKKVLQRKLPEVMPELGDDMHPVLKRVYAARGVESRQELEASLDKGKAFFA